MFLITVDPEASDWCTSHKYKMCLVSLCFLVLVLCPFLNSHRHVVTFFCILSYVVSSDERLFLVVHSELSQVEHASKLTLSWAQTTQAARFERQSAIVSGCLGHPSWVMWRVLNHLQVNRPSLCSMFQVKWNLIDQACVVHFRLSTD